MKILHTISVKRYYVIYFNGFSLKGEEKLFKQYFVPTDTTVVGFSYGAQKALDYAYYTTERVDRLVLLSPAFFQNKKPSFIRTQLRYFEAGHEAYVKQFLLNVSYPSSTDLSNYLETGSNDELSTLLTYEWDSQKITEILNRGTTIEVFLGEKDKIIDFDAARAFFTQTSTYTIKGVGHLLEEGIV